MADARNRKESERLAYLLAHITNSNPYRTRNVKATDFLQSGSSKRKPVATVGIAGMEAILTGKAIPHGEIW